jgi:Beta-galactosidase jelly roll domain
MPQSLRAACAASSSTMARLAPGKFKAKLADTQGQTSYLSPRGLIHSASCSFPDTTRGVLNEGGLFGERAGWHLPGFDTSSWVERDLSAGLPNGAAGIGFFVTTFPLNIPAGFDVMLSFTFDESAQPYRALLFVNGWMMGKRVANLGYAEREYEEGEHH